MIVDCFSNYLLFKLSQTSAMIDIVILASKLFRRFFLLTNSKNVFTIRFVKYIVTCILSISGNGFWSIYFSADISHTSPVY